MMQKQIIKTLSTPNFWMIMLFTAGTIFFFTHQPVREEKPALPKAVVRTSPTPVPLIKSPVNKSNVQTMGTTIKVRAGETFWTLARKHCGSHRYAESIAAQNGYTNARKLREGAVLHLTCVLK